MTKYELTVHHDDSTSMTYKFEVEFIHEVSHHLEEFLRASGFTYVETVEIYDEKGKQLSTNDDYRINVADGDDVWATLDEKFEDNEEAAQEESVPVVAAAKKGSKKSKKKSNK